LKKFNVSCEIDSSSIIVKENQKIVQPNTIIECHNDHRIAMSIAPLSMKVDSIKFDDKEVVNKSYPKFWEDFNRASKNNN
jgi:3-phosphoshikimate 1-carboxyvinyltransferase